MQKILDHLMKIAIVMLVKTTQEDILDIFLKQMKF